MATPASLEVLEFYRALPFNYHGSVEAQAEEIRRDRASLAANPPLLELLPRVRSVLDVGCGAGWLANRIALDHPCRVTGIDFNPVAVERARAVAERLGTSAEFHVHDLFTYRPEPRPDLVVSLGVLHHTRDCLAAVEHLIEACVSEGGHLYVGLYHAFGREPFLRHFRELRERGATEDELFASYRELHHYLTDETHLRSWFRDQVLHPLETQHTLEEMVKVLDAHGLELVSTSINRFQPIGDRAQLFGLERDFQRRGEEALARKRYFPGFFTFLARRP